MKFTYIIGTLLLLASLALGSDPEDPVMFLRKLRKETRDTNNNNARGLDRGGKRTLETKKGTPKTNKNRPPELQMAAATERSRPLDPNSCKSQCGGYTGSCGCDIDCQEYNDCCNDVCDECSFLSHCPPNDLCVNALALQSFQRGSTVSATLDNVGTCGTGNDNTAPGVWYKVSGISGQATVDTCSSFTKFDTQVSVFRGSCGGLTCVNGNDDDSSCSLGGSLRGFQSRVTWTATASKQYFVLVHGYSSANGEFGLNAALPITNPDPNSCEGNCNGQAPGGCLCDDACDGYGDCCSDACDECSFLSFCPVTNPDANSCAGYCNIEAPGGCWCDVTCEGMGDCCNDVCDECSLFFC